VGYLLEQVRLNGENRELVDEIVALGTRFGIVTPYTSFLVVDDVKDVAGVPRPRPRNMDQLSVVTSERLRQDLEMATNAPSGAPGVAGGAGTGIGTGAGVRRSKAEARMKSSDEVFAPDQYLTTIKIVRGKTFLLKDGVWLDTDYKADSTLKQLEIKFGSDEFFALLARNPELAEYFSIGERVVVVVGDRVYKVI
jgi:Ca-activated chloride channel family protein